MKWIESYRVNSHDCDESGKVRPSPLLRYMQETANLQLRTLGPTSEQLLAEDRAFILSRINISVYGELHAYDKIDVESWACESRGATFNRCYSMRRGSELIAEASSVWGLIGISDRKIYRVDEIKLGFEIDEPLELDAPKRVHIPRELTPALVGERSVMYSDIDKNHHMNNTNYPDMLCGFIPEISKKRILGMSISFAGEAKIGETLKVYMAENDGSYYFRTVKSDGGVNIEASVLTDN